MSSLQSLTQTFPSTRPRVFILTDISNEPDDAESLVRYLLYSNQFRTEGIVAVTSTWMKNKTCPQDIHKILNAYEKAVGNLNNHVHPDFPYPSAGELRELVKTGPSCYGFEALGGYEGKEWEMSSGAQLLLERLEASIGEEGNDPLWVLVWGGTNVLAQVLMHAKSNCDEEEITRLLSRLRVYAISDQDDTASWIRRSFPNIFYISSVHAWNQYGIAAWTGIGGDKYYGFDQGGPDFDKLTKEWIKENIQTGPLGEAYPDYIFIPEGDTPTFLYLVQNGLGVPEHPEYGSWGGRYELSDKGPTRHAGRHYGDAHDSVTGKDGNVHRSNQATIWRWRDAFQNDFAARMRWSLTTDFKEANHHPVVCVNGTKGFEPLEIEAEAGSIVELDAEGTYDPDGNAEGLSFKWFHYREPTATQWSTHLEVQEVEFTPIDEWKKGKKVQMKLPGPEKCCVDLMSRKPVRKGQKMHLILEVTDRGTPPLKSYRRVIVQTTNRELKGGVGDGEDHGNIADAMAGMQ
ncbi:cellulose-binding protein [Zalerion maritima]|uniref:Cellulose-binding protein n=1 Tax=Zalerion maritima TaxID=339359 RepID=A0AAD5WTE5_9PEZI|nr:cellulose-binding protein [Zalerion maritima]